MLPRLSHKNYLKRIQAVSKLPNHLCLNTTISCGKRHANKSCSCYACTYNLDTRVLAMEVKSALLLRYFNTEED